MRKRTCRERCVSGETLGGAVKYDLKKVFDNFQIEGQFLQAAPYGSGHINDTFSV